MNTLDRSNVGQYVLFFDNDDELRAGKIYDMENLEVLVHSLRKNSRGSSKLYYYNLKESEIFKVVTKECALHFVHEEGIVVKNKKDFLSHESTRNIKNILTGLKDEIEFSGHPNIKKEYDESLDRFGLDQLDYKMLEMLLSNSTFHSLSERTTRIDLVEFVSSIYSSPSISAYYSALIRLYDLHEKTISISKYKDGILEKCKRHDLMNRDIEEHIQCKFIEYIDSSDIKEEMKVLSIRISTRPYTFLLRTLTNKRKQCDSLKKSTPYDYFLPRIISELVANSDCIECRFKELWVYGLLRSNSDEYIDEILTSTMKKLYTEIFVNIEYSFKHYVIELRLNQISDFNKRFFNHSENYVKAGDLIKTLSNRISAKE